MTRSLAPVALAAAGITLLALAACNPETNRDGAACDRPGAITAEHPDPSTTLTYRCTTDPDGQHAHWVRVR